MDQPLSSWAQEDGNSISEMGATETRISEVGYPSFSVREIYPDFFLTFHAFVYPGMVENAVVAVWCCSVALPCCSGFAECMYVYPYVRTDFRPTETKKTKQNKQIFFLHAELFWRDVGLPGSR